MIKRYDLGGIGDDYYMEEEADGDYVKFSDYQALEDMWRQCKEANDMLAACRNRVHTVLAARFTEAGLCPDPEGEMCWADDLEKALEIYR